MIKDGYGQIQEGKTYHVTGTGLFQEWDDGTCVFRIPTGKIELAVASDETPEPSMADLMREYGIAVLARDDDFVAYVWMLVDDKGTGPTPEDAVRACVAKIKGE